MDEKNSTEEPSDTGPKQAEEFSTLHIKNVPIEDVDGRIDPDSARKLVMDIGSKCLSFSQNLILTL